MWESLKLNMAMCDLKRDEWTRTIDCCTEVLNINPKSVKALYRRAVALERTKEFKKAQKDLKDAAELAPEDKAVARLQKRVAAQLKREKAKAAKMAKKMFA